MFASNVGASKQTNDWTIKARQGVNTLAYLSGGSMTKAKKFYKIGTWWIWETNPGENII
jgi:hypothetical protein